MHRGWVTSAPRHHCGPGPCSKCHASCVASEAEQLCVVMASLRVGRCLPFLLRQAGGPWSCLGARCSRAACGGSSSSPCCRRRCRWGCGVVVVWQPVGARGPASGCAPRSVVGGARAHPSNVYPQDAPPFVLTLGDDDICVGQRSIVYILHKCSVSVWHATARSLVRGSVSPAAPAHQHAGSAAQCLSHLNAERRPF